MRSAAIWIFLGAFAGAASAATVWQEDFSTAPGLTLDGTANIPSERTGTDWWYGLGASVTSAQMEILGKENLALRGVAKVWSSTANLASGTYTLTFDVTSQTGSTPTYHFFIYDAERSSGGYSIVTAGANGTTPGAFTLGGSVSELDSFSYASGSADQGTVTGVTLNFTHDDTNDLVFVSAVTGYTYQNTTAYSLDNMVITDSGSSPITNAPAFAVNPIYKPGAFVDTPYSNSIAFSAYDKDGDALTYAKVGGTPAWLTVDPDGTLHGTPGAADLGEQTVSVQVTSADGSDTAAMNLHVLPQPSFRGKPNILYILADDLGYLDISAHEYFDNPDKQDLEFKTPNIDTLFNDGIHFKAALMANSVCAPSRAGLLTGRMGSRFGFEANIPHDYSSLPGSTIGLETNQVTIADVLKNGAGYKTYCIGKWHLGDNTNRFHPNSRGFDEFYGIIGGSRNYVYVDPAGLSEDKLIMSNQTVIAEPSDMYITDFFTDQALNYITEQTTDNPDQPWFMYMSFTAPHGPMDAKEQDLARVPRVSHFGDQYDTDIPVKILGTNGGVSSSTSRDNDYLRRVYGAMVLSMDDNVGRLLNRLDDLGITENTIVIFHSDNGGPAKGHNWSLNKPLRGYKGDLWEGGLRVPFAIYWPGVIPAGQVAGFDTPISSLDMMPTVAAISGADQTQEIRTDGINLMPLLKGRISTLPARQLYWRRGTTLQIATRSGNYKYYKNRNTNIEYLFDLENSASEWFEGLIDSQPGIAAQLAAEYAEFEATIPDPHWNGDGELLAITTYDLDDAIAGQAYAMPLTHSPAGQSVTWSLMAGNPDWLSINPSSGELTGSPAATNAMHNLITLQIDTGTATSTYTVPLTVLGGFDPDDTDADGLPDAWELAQFTNLTVTAGGPNEDQDADGSPDRKEYVEGTSATNPVSRLVLPVTPAEDGTFEVSFDGVTNRSYVLHTTADLTGGVWLYADSVLPLQSNGTVTLQADRVGDPDTFFGRIGVKTE